MLEKRHQQRKKISLYEFQNYVEMQQIGIGKINNIDRGS